MEKLVKIINFILADYLLFLIVASAGYLIIIIIKFLALSQSYVVDYTNYFFNIQIEFRPFFENKKALLIWSLLLNCQSRKKWRLSHFKLFWKQAARAKSSRNRSGLLSVGWYSARQMSSLFWTLMPGFYIIEFTLKKGGKRLRVSRLISLFCHKSFKRGA